MSWAKLSADTSISHDVITNFPTNFWGQVDVWIPPQTFSACFDGELFGVTAQFIDFNNDALHARLFSGVWKWETDYSTVATTGPSPSTTYTIKFHYVYSGGSSATVNWYVNGSLVATDNSVNHFTQHQFFLNHPPEGCCCETYYYTNVLVGTSEGSGDIFSDDFSSGFVNWTRNQFNTPSALAVVSSPSSAACPTISFSPSHGLPGDTFTVNVSGLAPSSALEMFFDNHNLEISESSDVSGNASFTVTIPHLASSGSFEGYSVYLNDDQANIACSESFNPGGGFDICGGVFADGITTVPNPVLATGGITNNTNHIIDYIYHDGAHWVLWQDPSSTDGFAGGNLSTFPPPTNHTMNATRISGDGSSITDYPIDSGYRWYFGSGDDNDEGLFSSRPCGSGGDVSAPVWSQILYFSSWAKPILDAHFASDGTNLWVTLLTEETVPYPWLDNSDACGPNPGSANQFQTLASWTAGFTSFPTNTGTGRHIWNTQTDGPINQYESQAFPVTDSGEETSGYWSPPLVVMYGFDGSNFNRIGEIDAKYCPGTTQYFGNEGILGTPSFINGAPRGSCYSRASICANPNDPGRCHVIWSEAGMWGRVGLAAADCTRLVWDAGPQNYDARVNYTTWSSTGKLSDADIWHSHSDRTSAFFPNDYATGGGDFTCGYTYGNPANAPDNFAFLSNHDLRNDNVDGTPYLFGVWPAMFQNCQVPEASNDIGYAEPPAYIDPHGHPWLDWTPLFGDTLHVYDLSSGGATEVQTLDLSTLATTESELESMFTVSAPWAKPVGPADCVRAPSTIFFDPRNQDMTSNEKGFGISLPYDDPDLGIPVYLIHIPLQKRWLNQATAPPFLNSENFTTRNFFRIPCDMSGEFDYLDGDREINFTITKEPLSSFSYPNQFYSSDFWSDEKNIWVAAPDPAGFFGFGFNGYTGLWFDRVCLNQWVGLNFTPPLTPPKNSYWLGSQCPGFYYDPVTDSVTTVAGASANETNGGPLFAITTLFFCRGCRNCRCGTGIHIAHRF